MLAPMPPDLPGDPLDLLRAQSGLSIDDEGRFRHRGERITHARTLEVLWRSLTRRPDGRWQVQVGPETAFVHVERAPYGVHAAAVEPERVVLHLTDGSAEPLEPRSLRLGDDGVLSCTVKGGAQARFGRAAQAALAPILEEDGARPGRHQLRVGGQVWPIGLP
jgi:hypothetical protein